MANIKNHIIIQQLLTYLSDIDGSAIGAGGEINTASNIGTGEGIFAQKVLYDLEFKSLVAGTNVSLDSDGETITINATGVDNTLQSAYDNGTTINLVEGFLEGFTVLPPNQTEGQMFKVYSFESISYGFFALDHVNFVGQNEIGFGSFGEMIFQDQHLTTFVSLSEVGEAELDTTSASIVGAINEIKGDVDNIVVSLQSAYDSGSNIEIASAEPLSFTEGTSHFTLTASGESDALILTTGLNRADLTTQQNINLESTGENIRLKDQNLATWVTLSESGETQLDTTSNSLVGAINELAAGSGGGETNTASNAGAGAGLALAKVGVDLPFKSLTAGTGVTLNESADEIEIVASGGSGGSGDAISIQGVLVPPLPDTSLDWKLILSEGENLVKQSDDIQAYPTPWNNFRVEFDNTETELSPLNGKPWVGIGHTNTSGIISLTQTCENRPSGSAQYITIAIKPDASPTNGYFAVVLAQGTFVIDLSTQTASHNPNSWVYSYDGTLLKITVPPSAGNTCTINLYPSNTATGGSNYAGNGNIDMWVGGVQISSIEQQGYVPTLASGVYNQPTYYWVKEVPAGETIIRTYNVFNGQAQKTTNEVAGNLGMMHRVFVTNTSTVSKIVFYLGNYWGSFPSSGDVLGTAVYSDDGTTATQIALKQTDTVGNHITNGDLIDEGQGFWSLKLDVPVELTGGEQYIFGIYCHDNSGGGGAKLLSKTCFQNTNTPANSPVGGKYLDWDAGIGASVNFPTTFTLATLQAQSNAWFLGGI